MRNPPLNPCPFIGAALVMILTGCTAAPGTAPAPDPARSLDQAAAAALKDLAIAGAKEEIDLRAGRRLQFGVLLDTVVGPTPPDVARPAVHPRPWVDSLRRTRTVDGIFNMAPGVMPKREAYVISIGQPYRRAADTAGVEYTWRLDITNEDNSPRCGYAWRDLFLPKGNGWERVAHQPVATIGACGV
ncbi:MAG: hypothetical protein AB7I33_01335 [Gemmatimonadales bacterium]